MVQKSLAEKSKEKKHQIIKLKCPKCKIDTNHKREWINFSHGESKDGDLWLDTLYEVFSCMGCGAVTLSESSQFSEDLFQDDEGNVDIEIQTIYWPKRDSRLINPKVEDWCLPQKVRRVYKETIGAYNNELFILCAIGIRAVIEAVCSEENITIDGLDKKINELESKKIITPALAEGLNQNRLVGNASAHELQVFGENDLLDAISLIENLLESHYTIPEKIKNLKRITSKK